MTIIVYFLKFKYKFKSRLRVCTPSAKTKKKNFQKYNLNIKYTELIRDHKVKK